MAISLGVSEMPEPDSGNPKIPDVKLDSSVYGIPWPANRLTYGQMRTLRQISKDVRLPITQLLKDAVDLYLSLLQREMQAAMMVEQDRQVDKIKLTDDHQPEFVSPAPADDRPEFRDEISPTGRMPTSGGHEKTKMIAERTTGPETESPLEIVEPSGPKTQRSFMFLGD